MTAKKAPILSQKSRREFVTDLRRKGQQIQGIDWILECDDDPFPAPASTTRATETTKGLLFLAAVVIVDELFMDVKAIAAGEPPAETRVISQLPSRYEAEYTMLFAQRFLVSMVEVTVRFTEGWMPLACVAQELALHLLLEEVDAAAEIFQIDVDPRLTQDLSEGLFEDEDYLDLYADDEALGHRPVNTWFTPFNESRHCAPYVHNAGRGQREIRNGVGLSGHCE